MSGRFAHFQLDPEPLGTGQSGAVYRATNEANGTVCALKILDEECFRDPILHKRFEREVKVLETLKHPAIVRILDSGVHEGHPWIAMTYCEGQSLRALDECNGSTVGRKLRGLARIAAALDYSHGEGIIHRDLKPSNILIDGNGDYFLSDFGIAKLTGDATRITSTGNVLGTAAYMSPEQAQDLEIGPPSDIYSLGVIAYQAVLGKLPFVGASVPVVMLKHITEAVPIPGGTNPIIASVLRRALAKDPSQRWKSATDLVSVLNEALLDALQSRVDSIEITQIKPVKLEKPRVLVIEESGEYCSHIEFKLKYEGLVPIVARSGPEGLSKLKGGSYDVIFVQTDLETVSGLDIARRVREIEKRYGTRALIVGMSSNLGDECMRDAMRSGIDQLVARPMDKEFLDAFLRTYRR